MTISKLYQNSIQKKIGFSLVAIITCILTLFGIYRYFVIKSESTRGKFMILPRLPSNVWQSIWSFQCGTLIKN